MGNLFLKNKPTKIGKTAAGGERLQHFPDCTDSGILLPELFFPEL